MARRSRSSRGSRKSTRSSSRKSARKPSGRTTRSSSAVKSKPKAQKYGPIFLGAMITLSFVIIALVVPGLGPALPSTPEMWIIMIAIMFVGLAIIIHSVSKLRHMPPDRAHGLAFIIAGLILFVGVTVIDVPIHTEFIEFSQLTHTLWHMTELVGLIFIGIGVYKVARAN